MFWETTQSNVSFETTNTNTHKAYLEYILLPNETMQTQYTGISNTPLVSVTHLSCQYLSWQCQPGTAEPCPPSAWCAPLPLRCPPSPSRLSPAPMHHTKACNPSSGTVHNKTHMNFRKLHNANTNTKGITKLWAALIVKYNSFFLHPLMFWD